MQLYTTIEPSELISQGDILFNFPILIAGINEVERLPDFSKDSIQQQAYFDILRSDIIILSQACDLANEPDRNRKPIESVICASIFPMNAYSKTIVQETNSGKRPSYYLLHKEDGLLDKTYIIDFTKLYTIPYELLNKFAHRQTNRVRPTSPFLEQISHHFGNFFSRVGSDYERSKGDLSSEYELLEQQKNNK